VTEGDGEKNHAPEVERSRLGKNQQGAMWHVGGVEKDRLSKTEKERPYITELGLSTSV